MHFAGKLNADPLVVAIVAICLLFWPQSGVLFLLLEGDFHARSLVAALLACVAGA